MLRMLMVVLSTFTSVYMLILLVRILLTWFSGISYSRAIDVLSRITDPYLNWFRRFPVLRIGYLDLSPVAALAVLSVANRTFAILARYGTISIGIILAMFLQALWSAVSFILGFFILILILRLIAYLTNRNVYSAFWRVIDTISQPLLFRINRILFGNRIVHYRTSLMLAVLVLGAAMIVLGVFAGILSGLLARLPV